MGGDNDERVNCLTRHEIIENFIDTQVDLSIKYERAKTQHERIRNTLNFTMPYSIFKYKIPSCNKMLEIDIDIYNKENVLHLLKIQEFTNQMNELINGYNKIINDFHVILDWIYRKSNNLLHTIKIEHIHKYEKFFNNAANLIKTAHENKENYDIVYEFDDLYKADMKIRKKNKKNVTFEIM